MIPGSTELLIIFGVALLLFGPTKLPKLGSAIGESIRNFRRGMNKPHEEPSDKEDSKKKIEKDLNNFLKKIKKSKKNYLITKDIIVIESLKFDGIEINEDYSDLYTVNENTMPIDIQVLINDGEIGLAMLRIIEIIGEDELKNLGSETLYFLVNALNQMDIDLIRNEILSAILPVRV